ncbi:hypothetical protein ACFRLW_07195 [Streptomyces sp. NPDC056728]
MGNLGAYQVITTAAKRAGGVEALLREIKKGAFDKGLKVGAVGGALAASGAVAVASRVRGAQKARQERAEEAEAQLKAQVQESTDLKDS